MPSGNRNLCELPWKTFTGFNAITFRPHSNDSTMKRKIVAIQSEFHWNCFIENSKRETSTQVYCRRSCIIQPVSFKEFWHWLCDKWILMEIRKNIETYGVLWKLMETYGNLWNLMESYGILWNLMESYVNLRSLMESRRVPEGLIGSFIVLQRVSNEVLQNLLQGPKGS